MQVPSPEKQWKQPNDGSGNIAGTFNVTIKDGSLRVSEPVLKGINTDDDADLGEYVGAFCEYGGSLYAICDELFSNINETDPVTGWTDVALVDSTGNSITDMVSFDGLLLYSQTNDIKSYNGSADADWWTSTLGQSALTTGNRHILEVGPDGNLYIVDAGNKIYRVTPAAVVTKTGAGTLDFSARPLTITTMVSNSTRLWIGFQAADGFSTYIAEWDMGPQSIAPNRLHPIPARTVLCIAIWNDTPIAVLSTGKIMYFNGSSFTEWESAQFPLANTDKVMDESFMHWNGWAIIDGLPHFLVGSKAATPTATADITQSDWSQAAGVWCLDPKIGLYHRFALGAGTSTQLDYGQPVLVNTGALYATEGRKTKFVASYEHKNATGTTKATIAYHDKTRSKPARGWFATEWMEDPQVQAWGTIKTLFKKLESGEKINIYYRLEDGEQTTLSGTWANTSEFHTTETATDVSTGDLMFIKQGPAAGSISKITKTTSSLTTVLKMDSASSLITAGDTGVVDVLNFKKLKSITNTSADWDTVAIPNTTKTRKIQLLIELQQNASSTCELDYVIIE